MSAKRSRPESEETPSNESLPKQQCVIPTAIPTDDDVNAIIPSSSSITPPSSPSFSSPSSSSSSSSASSTSSSSSSSSASSSSSSSSSSSPSSSSFLFLPIETEFTTSILQVIPNDLDHKHPQLALDLPSDPTKSFVAQVIPRKGSRSKPWIACVFSRTAKKRLNALLHIVPKEDDLSFSNFADFLLKGEEEGEPFEFSREVLYQKWENYVIHIRELARWRDKYSCAETRPRSWRSRDGYLDVTEYYFMTLKYDDPEELRFKAKNCHHIFVALLQMQPQACSVVSLHQWYPQILLPSIGKPNPVPPVVTTEWSFKDATTYRRDIQRLWWVYLFDHHQCCKATPPLPNYDDWRIVFNFLYPPALFTEKMMGLPQISLIKQLVEYAIMQPHKPSIQTFCGKYALLDAVQCCQEHDAYQQHTARQSESIAGRTVVPDYLYDLTYSVFPFLCAPKNHREELARAGLKTRHDIVLAALLLNVGINICLALRAPTRLPSSQLIKNTCDSMLSFFGGNPVLFSKPSCIRRISFALLACFGSVSPARGKYVGGLSHDITTHFSFLRECRLELDVAHFIISLAHLTVPINGDYGNLEKHKASFDYHLLMADRFFLRAIDTGCFKNLKFIRKLSSINHVPVSADHYCTSFRAIAHGNVQLYTLCGAFFILACLNHFEG